MSGSPHDQLADARATARQRAEGGDLTGARALLEEAIEDAQLLLGSEHPRLVPLMVDLATIARELGNLTEAQARLRQAHRIVAASAGSEHAMALAVEARLAAVTYRLGERSDAHDLHLIDAGMRVLGPEHPMVRAARDRLAGARPLPAPASAEPVSPGFGYQYNGPGHDATGSSYGATEPGLLSPDHGQLPPLAQQLPAEPEQLPPAAVRPPAGYPPPNAGYPPADPGYPPADLGYPPPDAGYPPADLGYPPADLGSPPADAGYLPAEPGYAPTVPGQATAEARYQSIEPEELTPDLGRPPIYAPSPRAPGVYDRRAEAEGVYLVAPSPDRQRELEAWPEEPTAPLPPSTLPAGPPSRALRDSKPALVAGLCATALLAIAVITTQVVTPARSGQPDRAAPAVPGAPTSARPAVPGLAAPGPGTPGSVTPAQPAGTPDPSSPHGPQAPTGLSLRDTGGSVTLTWRDPASGTVPFIVAGGRVGTASSPLATVPAGRTTSTIYGLNRQYDYCFTVTAIYSTTVTAPSLRTCTHRLSTASQP